MAEHGPSRAGDVFGLAATAWNVLFGQLPHGDYSSAPDLQAAWIRALKRAEAFEVRRPVELPAGMPGGLVDVLSSGLLPRPEQRPKLDVFLDRLRKIQEAPDRRRAGWRERIPVAAAIGLLSSAIAAAGVTMQERLSPIEGPPMIWEIVAIERPLARAELAAEAGDGETAIAELNYAFTRARAASGDELDRLIVAAEGVAKALELTSPDHAIVAWAHVRVLHALRVRRT